MNAMTSPPTVAVEHLFTMRAELGPRRDAGPGPVGRRSYNAVERGSFEGPKLRGEILPGSADWMLVRPDGSIMMDARAVLLTDDGAVIHASYGGQVNHPADLPEAGAQTGKLVRPDGSIMMDARAVLLTDDGAVIHMSYGGRIIIPPDLLEAVRDREERERVDPTSYYLRTLPTFETGAEGYGWLNNIVDVGKGYLLADGVGYDVFAVL